MTQSSPSSYQVQQSTARFAIVDAHHRESHKMTIARSKLFGPCAPYINPANSSMWKLQSSDSILLKFEKVCSPKLWIEIYLHLWHESHDQPINASTHKSKRK